MTTQTLTLTDFLLARIAEDEVLATSSPDRWGPHGRALAECEAKRQVVEDYRVVSSIGLAAADPCALRVLQAQCDTLDQTLRRLATVYADHPDYRPEWRP